MRAGTKEKLKVAIHDTLCGVVLGVLSWLSFLKELSFTMPLIFFIFAMIWDLNFCMSTKMGEG